MLQIIEAEMARHREALARLGQVAARLKSLSQPASQSPACGRAILKTRGEAGFNDDAVS